MCQRNSGFANGYEVVWYHPKSILTIDVRNQCSRIQFQCGHDS